MSCVQFLLSSLPLILASARLKSAKLFVAFNKFYEISARDIYVLNIAIRLILAPCMYLNHEIKLGVSFSSTKKVGLDVYYKWSKKLMSRQVKLNNAHALVPCCFYVHVLGFILCVLT